MGSKPSTNFQRDRPESGGADRDDEREKSGLLELDKEKFSAAESKRRSSAPSATDQNKGKPDRDPVD